MRGKEVVGGDQAVEHGITPAYAGKSNHSLRCDLADEDHPRVCGEKLYMPCWIAPSVGSPPRMRGKGLSNRLYTFAMGITPAYAGKRKIRSSLRRAIKDHPRVCGEKSFRVAYLSAF